MKRILAMAGLAVFSLVMSFEAFARSNAPLSLRYLTRPNPNGDLFYDISEKAKSFKDTAYFFSRSQMYLEKENMCPPLHSMTCEQIGMLSDRAMGLAQDLASEAENLYHQAQNPGIGGGGRINVSINWSKQTDQLRKAYIDPIANIQFEIRRQLGAGNTWGESSVDEGCEDFLSTYWDLLYSIVPIVPPFGTGELDGEV